MSSRSVPVFERSALDERAQPLRKNSTEAVRKWRAANPGKNKESHWRENDIKFTSQEYDVLYNLQDGLCCLCGQPPGKKALGPDHNHSTGVVRALLCGRCNSGIGLLRESPALLREAAEYLETYNQREEQYVWI